MDISSPITGVKGVGAKTEQLFQKTGVYTVGDILLRFRANMRNFRLPLKSAVPVPDKNRRCLCMWTRLLS